MDMIITAIPIVLFCLYYMFFGEGPLRRYLMIAASVIALPIAFIFGSWFGGLLCVYFIYVALYSSSDPNSKHYDQWGQAGKSKPLMGPDKE